MSKNITFNEIELFFKNYEFTDDIIDISCCETIVNIEKCVKSHLEIIKRNRNKSADYKRSLMPYWSRLVKVYMILNTKYI